MSRKHACHVCCGYNQEAANCIPKSWGLAAHLTAFPLAQPQVSPKRFPPLWLPLQIVCNCSNMKVPNLDKQLHSSYEFKKRAMSEEPNASRKARITEGHRLVMRTPLLGQWKQNLRKVTATWTLLPSQGRNLASIACREKLECSRLPYSPL